MRGRPGLDEADKIAPGSVEPGLRKMLGGYRLTGAISPTMNGVSVFMQAGMEYAPVTTSPNVSGGAAPGDVWRRLTLTRRVGIQAQLMLTFMYVLALGLALGASGWVYLSRGGHFNELLPHAAASDAASHQADIFAGLVGCGMALLCVPIAWGLMHRVFSPIRQLVTAANKIAAGELNTQVAIDRLDAIGDLARAFNAMSLTVKRHQDQLAAANALLESANRDLEIKVRQRTAQLESANQRLSNEIAEKEDFLRAVSHDLNAPPRNISGMTAMLLLKHRADFHPDVVNRLERIQKNVEIETDLIGELLELSRIKSRRQAPERVETSTVVGELAEMFESDLKQHKIAFVVDGPLPAINGEKTRIRQVFQNLVDNAIKYMGTGPTREIHVGCRPVGGEFEFYVRDTGMGIDPEDLAKVFFVFRRGKNSHVNHVPGKGVGLASVKSIIETHNGAIRVESALGQGSTFRFTIGDPGAVSPRGAATHAA
jgi:signal transduction histidine kinase